MNANIAQPATRDCSSSSFSIAPPLNKLGTDEMVSAAPGDGFESVDLVKEEGAVDTGGGKGSSELGEPSQRLRPVQKEMERGYAMSPMAELDLKYLRDEENETSTFTWVIMMIASKRSLEVYDILDRGILESDSIPRFSIEKGLSLRVQQTIGEFQSLLQQAAKLIEGRSSHFVVDPHNMLFGILRGCESLSELHVTWQALSKQFGLGQEYMAKYQSEYGAAIEAELIRSPTLTASMVYDQLVAFESPRGRLAYLYEQVPHHNEDLPDQLIGAAVEFKDLEEILSIPDRLMRAFPQRNPEERPSTVFYSAAGERFERPLSSRSSWQAAEDFEAPEEVAARPSEQEEMKEP
ncbi:hypothetical protein C8J57DRAFT_1541130 [Mycena rebaudengoi]|nr:hypothetical protein C8J57DRAFT_1541130 [Mycena rebaudengoi]